MSGSTSAYTPRHPAGVARAAEGGAGTVRGTAWPPSMRGPGQRIAPVPVPPSHHKGNRMAREWPLCDYIELGALPTAAPCARYHTRLILEEWGRLADSIESAELLVSELITNAITASRSQGGTFPVRLWLLADKTGVLTLVWDACLREPARMRISEDAESGRGLLLVETISDRWGWYSPQDISGKVAWAEVR